MSERRAIVTAAAIVMLGNVASRLLGVVRELVIADRFGATAATSSFVAASTVPTMVYDLLIGGAISAALVPVFSEYVAAGREPELRRAVGTVMVLVTLVLTAAALALIAVAPALVSLLVPGLEPAVQAQSIALTRLALPAVVLLGLSGVAAALLNSRQVFTYPAFSGTMYNLGIIACAVLFAFSLGITSLVIGVLLGAGLHLVLQLSGLRRGMPSLSFDLRHPAVSRILRLYAPVALGLVVSQIGVVIDRNLASRTGEDSLAVLRFATTLVQFPVGMVVTATTTAILPTLSRHAASTSAEAPAYAEARPAAPAHLNGSDPGRYTRTLALGLRMVLLTVIPLMALMIVEREPLVRLLFQRGAFDAVATQRTAMAFLFYAPQLPFVALDLLLIAAFYARQNTRTPTLVGVAGVLVFLTAGVVLIQMMGMPGLALANTIQHVFHSLVLLALIWRPIGGLQGYGLGGAIGKAAVASTATAGLWWLLAPGVATALGAERAVGVAAYLVAAGAVWLGSYCGILYVWGVPEMRMPLAMVRVRLRR
ncbi:MAG: murein biosynthesis integral membrane protein MurJ [Chloroflexi bacterium]|nr:murein biosynthesis integral membrane protein MurJ [Chloroflexota bacterium]